MVNSKLLQPQEVEVWYILPAIRRELSIKMKGLGLEQKEIARVLGVSAAAISHYFTNKRAKEVQFDQSMKEEIINSAKEIIRDNSKVTPEIQKLLKTVWVKKVVCGIHKMHGNIDENCEVCFQK